MKDVPENELFSAYLDGELTATEQADVEQLLAASPDARQLLDELRALSSTLQSMPQYTLDDDLSGPVLRMAERRVLTGGGLPRRPVEPLRNFRRRFLGSRALIWSTLAVAAALVVMIYGPEESPRLDDNGLARAPRPAAEPGVAPSIRAVDPVDAPGEERESAEVSEKTAELKLAPATPGPGSMTVVTNGGVQEVPSKAGSYSTLKHRATIRADQPVAKKPSAGVELSDRYANGTIANKIAPVAEKGAARFKGKQAAGGDYGGTMHDSDADGGAQYYSYADRSGQAAQLTTAADGVMLVQCDISLDAAEKQLFDKLLTSNGIALSDGRQTGGGMLRKSGLADTNARSLFRQRRELKADAPGDLAGDLVGEGAVDVVYVEATPAQIEATLAQLSAQSEQFLSVTVEPAPGVEQQRAYGRFNRRHAPSQKARGGHQASSARGQTERQKDLVVDKSGRKQDELYERTSEEQLGRARRMMTLPGEGLPAQPKSQAFGYRAEQTLRSGADQPEPSQLAGAASQPAATAPARPVQVGSVQPGSMAGKAGGSLPPANQPAESALDSLQIQTADGSLEEQGALGLAQSETPAGRAAPGQQATPVQPPPERPSPVIAQPSTAPQQLAAEEPAAPPDTSQQQKQEREEGGQRLVEAVPTYRALFVFRVVEPWLQADPTSAAAARMQPETGHAAQIEVEAAAEIASPEVDAMAEPPASAAEAAK